MTALAVPLEAAHEPARYGGKAAALSVAIRAGLPVPAGFALEHDAVAAIVAGDGAALAALDELLGALGPPVAARSSAVGEDGAGASFAGQHATVLNVRTADALRAAVRTVHASAHAESARAYRKRLGLEGEPRIGVVVQKLVEPVCAGVLFTRNPLTGADERVIEAAWGLGEAVVAGVVTPDSYRVARDGRLIEQRAGDKDLAIRPRADASGTYEEPVDAHLASAPCLEAKHLAELHALASRCEAHANGPVDVEWAFDARGTLHLLQHRPVTTGPGRRQSS